MGRGRGDRRSQVDGQGTVTVFGSGYFGLGGAYQIPGGSVMEQPHRIIVPRMVGQLVR